jgi:hypothetical protein
MPVTIDDAGTLTDQALADPVQGLQVKLVRRLGRNELHGRPLHRLGNRLRIAEVVLLSFARWRFLMPMKPSPYKSRVC